MPDQENALGCIIFPIAIWLIYVIFNSFFSESPDLAIMLVMYIVSTVGLAFAFKKANRNPFGAFIPIYNFVVMFEIGGKPTWHILLFVVPLANIYAFFGMYWAFGSRFTPNLLFPLGLMYLPFIFFPILGFGDAEYKEEGYC